MDVFAILPVFFFCITTIKHQSFPSSLCPLDLSLAGLASNPFMYKNVFVQLKSIPKICLHISLKRRNSTFRWLTNKNICGRCDCFISWKKTATGTEGDVKPLRDFQKTSIKLQLFMKASWFQQGELTACRSDTATLFVKAWFKFLTLNTVTKSLNICED